MKSEKLIEDAFFDWLELGDGIRRKVMAQNETMMIVNWVLTNMPLGLCAIIYIPKHPRFQKVNLKFRLERKSGF